MRNKNGFNRHFLDIATHARQAARAQQRKEIASWKVYCPERQCTKGPVIF